MPMVSDLPCYRDSDLGDQSLIHTIDDWSAHGRASCLSADHGLDKQGVNQAPGHQAA